MRLLQVTMVSLLSAATLATGGANAQCAGFTDVPAGGFCSQVTWIKNRQITTGCTSATLFCPNAVVTRLAMAVFMNRLGNVLTPFVLEEEATGASMTLTGPSYVCESDVVPAANYPRTMLAEATLSFALANIQDVRVGISTSINNGPYSFGSPIILRNGAGQHLLQYFSTQQAVDAGSSYKYAIRVDRASSSMVPLGAWACHLQVEVVNAFGTQ